MTAMSVGISIRTGKSINSIKNNGPSRLDHDKNIQEQVMDRLSGMAVCRSRHIAGKKLLDDAARELRCGVGGKVGWVEGLSHHWREQ